MTQLSQLPPQHPVNNDAIYTYAGFWIRFAAQLVDGVIILLVTMPMLYLVYGEDYFAPTESREMFLGVWDFVFSWVLPTVFVLGFWIKQGATPGKMLFGLKVLDEKTGNFLTLGQALLRYVSQFLSGIVLFLGYIWAGFDKKKQSWHDKIAKTVVVRESR